MSREEFALAAIAALAVIVFDILTGPARRDRAGGENVVRMADEGAGNLWRQVAKHQDDYQPGSGVASRDKSLLAFEKSDAHVVHGPPAAARARRSAHMRDLLPCVRSAHDRTV